MNAALPPSPQKLLDMLDATLPCKLMLDCMHCIAACLQFFGEEGVQEVAVFSLWGRLQGCWLPMNASSSVLGRCATRLSL